MIVRPSVLFQAKGVLSGGGRSPLPRKRGPPRLARARARPPRGAPAPHPVYGLPTKSKNRRQAKRRIGGACAPPRGATAPHPVHGLQPLRHQLQAIGGGSTFRGLLWGRAGANAFALRWWGLCSARLRTIPITAHHGRPLHCAPLACSLSFVATLKAVSARGYAPSGLFCRLPRGGMHSCRPCHHYRHDTHHSKAGAAGSATMMVKGLGSGSLLGLSQGFALAGSHTLSPKRPLSQPLRGSGGACHHCGRPCRPVLPLVMRVVPTPPPPPWGACRPPCPLPLHATRSMCLPCSFGRCRACPRSNSVYRSSLCALPPAHMFMCSLLAP